MTIVCFIVEPNRSQKFVFKVLKTVLTVKPLDTKLRYWWNVCCFLVGTGVYFECWWRLADLWNDSHFTPSQSTTPDVMRSSAKYRVSMPSSSCFLNWIPDVVSSSMESWAYMSSLQAQSAEDTLSSISGRGGVQPEPRAKLIYIHGINLK